MLTPTATDRRLGYGEVRGGDGVTEDESSRPLVSNWWSKVPEWLQVSIGVMGVLAGPASLVLGAQALANLDGPGWAKALAWFGCFLVVASLASVYLLQYRHHRVATELAQGYTTAVNDLHESHRAETAQLEKQFERDRRLSSALPKFHDALHKMRDAAVIIQDGGDEFAYGPLVVDSLSDLKDVFTSIVGAPCRVCFKELEATADATAGKDDNDPRFLEVHTGWRHDGSNDPAVDDASPLYANSDFEAVMNPANTQRCFLSNDLDAEPGYTNPHRTGDPEDFEYNATIVWPVQKQKGQGRIGILGFLCVDTKARNRFSFDPDFHIGAAYADTLYTALSQRNNTALNAPQGETDDDNQDS